MKTFFTVLIFATIGFTACSQFNQKTEKQNSDTDFTRNTVTYRLFPTENIWTFIKLNTRNGQMWQVQYDVKENNRFETYLNLTSLVTNENEVNGRFALYPTKNIYTFILLDQLDGKTWQVQWSIEAENRFVTPIE